jgi:hypothetical protein
VRFGFGCSRSGIRVTWRRSHSGARWRRSTTGSVGEAIVTQIRPSLPRALPGEPAAYDGARGGLGNRDVVLGGAERDPVGEGQPGEDDLDSSVTREPQQPAGPGVLDEVVLPLLDAEHRRGVGEPDGPVGGDRGVVAEQHLPAGHDIGDWLDRPGGGVDSEDAAVGVADEEASVRVDLEAERAAAGVGHPVDPSAVVADPEDVAVLGAREHRSLVGAVRGDHHVLCAGTGNGHAGELHAHMLR